MDSNLDAEDTMNLELVIDTRCREDVPLSVSADD